MQKSIPFYRKKALDVWSQATGIKKWDDFFFERYMISAFVNHNNELNIQFHRHGIDEGKTYFYPLYQDPELDIQIPGTSTNAELGKAVLDILAKGVARFEPDFFEIRSFTPSSLLLKIGERILTGTKTTKTPGAPFSKL